VVSAPSRRSRRVLWTLPALILAAAGAQAARVITGDPVPAAYAEMEKVGWERTGLSLRGVESEMSWLSWEARVAFEVTDPMRGELAVEIRQPFPFAAWQLVTLDFVPAETGDDGPP